MDLRMNYDGIMSSRIQQVQPSGIRKFFDILEEMKDAISLGVGEPDFVTPWHIRDAGIYSLEKGFTKYTSNAGMAELRREIAAYQERRFRLHYDFASQIIVTVGGSEAIDLALRCLINPGDEVILPDPCWVSYDACVRLAGGVPVYVKTTFENDFVLDPSDVEAAITPKTVAIIINSPSNPTGCVYSRDVIKAIAEIAERHDIMILSDEIYEHITYDCGNTSFASLPGMMDRVVTVSGLSKTYAMTGWRLGWAIASEENIKLLNKLQSHSISCCVSFTQTAAVEALNGPQEEKEAMVRKFKERRDLALNLLSEIPGLECNVPKGAFYLFPRYSAKVPSKDLCSDMLRKAHVAVTPGSAFGPAGEGFFRISYATSEDNIREGMSRIKSYMRSI